MYIVNIILRPEFVKYEVMYRGSRMCKLVIIECVWHNCTKRLEVQKFEWKGALWKGSIVKNKKESWYQK